MVALHNDTSSSSSSSAAFMLLWEPRFLQYLSQYMGSDRAHDLSHVQRVWCTCQRIASTEADANLQILLPASHLHDIECFPKNDARRAHASTLSAQRALNILAELGYPSHTFTDVYHAISAHSYSAGIVPVSLEAKILQDADRIDALGAVGLARVFHVAGQLDKPLYDRFDPRAIRRPLDDTAYTLDHFKQKLLRLSHGMNTTEGKRIALARTNYLKRFLVKFYSEIDATGSLG